mgnify:CR=1 FL=1
MFDKLEDLLIRFEEILSELQEPDVVNDPKFSGKNIIRLPGHPAQLWDHNI